MDIGGLLKAYSKKGIVINEKNALKIKKSTIIKVGDTNITCLIFKD